MFKEKGKVSIVNKILIVMLAIICVFAVLLISLTQLNKKSVETHVKETQGMIQNYATTAGNTWDVSKNGDGSVTATLSEDGTLTISGKGNMKDWNFSDKADWHNSEIKAKVNKVVINSGVTSIGDKAFQECSSLTNIYIPEGVTSIGYYAFEECSALTSINIPSTVTSIEAGAFRSCSSLTSINIPNTVTSIRGNAFSGCSSLTSIIIPSSVTSIESGTFYGCSSLTSINVPSAVTSIENGAFEGCSSLVEIKVDDNNEKYMDDNGVLYTKDGKEIMIYPRKREHTTYTILGGVARIGGSAFSGCSSLVSINIPNTVTSIGGSAFYNCSSLVSINIPEGVTSIESDAFRGCSSLVSIKIPESVTIIGDWAFDGCSKLTKINIPEGVTSIGSYAFSGCISLASIEIPSSVTSIGSSAFSGCISLTNINIPNTVTSFESDAFRGCSSLVSINIPEGVTSIESGAFRGCSSLVSIKIPESVTSIGDWAFDGCSKLTKINIPEGVTSIGSYAFYYCSSLTSINIPEGVTSIESETFYGCSSLTSIVIPEGVTSIGGRAFIYCRSLTSITIPEGVTSIEYLAFDNCSSLTSINIPSTVTSIGGGAFFECSNLTSINIPEGVTSIESQTFWGCSSLTSINIPEGVTSIESDAFRGCSSLTSIHIPEGVTSIESKTFYGCSSLISINIPEGVTSIERDAFSGCSSLTSINIPEGVTTIVDWSFSGCDNLTKITIPEGVKNIGEHLFITSAAMTSKTINIICKNNSTAHKYAKENEISYKIDDIAPTITFGTNGNSTASKTKSTTVKITDSTAGVNEKSLKYMWSTQSKNVTKEQIVNSFKNKGTLNLKDVTGAYYLWIYGKDYLGNESIVRSEAFVIDNTAPITNVSYSTIAKTNQNVKVTITADEKVQGIDGWTLSTDKKVLTKEYTQNRTESIIVKDIAGNETQVNISITNIDKIASTANVSYSTTELTKENVTVTITADEEIQTLSGWTLSADKRVLTKEYTQNITETIKIKDIVGNETPVNISITNIIDRTAPTTNVNYSTISKTNQNVKVTITANEEVQAIEGWTLSQDKKILTKEYAENKTETITIKDIVGNETHVEIRISNIDNIAPETEISYSITEPTRENITVTITADEAVQAVESWTLSTDKKVLTKEYAENTTETVTIKDIAGNERHVEVKIFNIDKIAPEVQISYSTTESTKENVTVTITAGEEIQTLSDWTLSADKRVLTKEYTQNKTETITIKDIAGNETYVEVKISNIDKAAPIVKIEYIQESNEKVKVRITANEEVQAIDGWILSQDKKVLTKEYFENTAETITIKDIAGNETYVEIKVTGIIKFNENTYKIKGNYVIDIQPKTTYENFIKNIATNSEYKVTEDNQEATGNTIIKTGQKLTVGNQTFTLVVIGDTNGDGQANIKDILSINKHRLNKAQLVNEYLQAGDINEDGKVNLRDILQINKYRLGKISEI